MATAGKKRLLSHADVNDIYYAHSRGEHQWQIAARYGVSQSCICKALHRHPLYQPKRKPQTGISERVKRKARVVQKAIEAGHAPKQIAAHPKINLSPNRVRQLAKINLESPPPRNQNESSN